MFKHTLEELKQWQSLPLDVKIMMSCDRIRDWIGEYGEDGTCISFSGGKDSTVLLDLIRNRCGFKNVPAIFVDVPTQFPESREFVQKFENVIIIKPKINFMQVCEKFGFPFISKEVSECVYSAKRSVQQMENDGYQLNLDDESELADALNKWNATKKQKNNALARLYGIMDNKGIVRPNIPEHDRTRYTFDKYKFMIKAKFNVSKECCRVMKKTPLHTYQQTTGRKPFTGIMADESRIRETQWMRNGCNIYDSKDAKSNPIAFWTEQDVLQYIYENHLPICPVYGEVVRKEKQLTFEELLTGDIKWEYEVTGAKRTGCMMCGFGCHLDGNPSRFERMKKTHPKMYALLDIVKNNGVTMRQAIEWMNENGQMNIRL